MSKIYLASSWRNEAQPALVAALRAEGHEVYDFRDPPHGNGGFAWSSIDPEWESWTVAQYRDALADPIAQAGFKSDFDAMKSADVCVLLLPCGRSAHLELGWMAGAGKRTIVVTEDGQEPELMALLATSIATTWAELLEQLATSQPSPILPDGNYAVVELMGHRTLIGRVAEVQQYGAALCTVEPIWQDKLLEPVTFSGSSIYMVTPISREVALRRQATREYQLPESVRATIPPAALPAPTRDTHSHEREDEDELSF